MSTLYSRRRVSHQNKSKSRKTTRLKRISKKTSLMGSYEKFERLGTKEQGFILIVKLMSTGLRFITRTPHRIVAGEILKVRIGSNSVDGEDLARNCLVRRVEDRLIEVDFCD